ncbi:MAG: hypothetical protein KGL10_01325 [Alphaproteobacteria bacterium]|nr:hypothetical protein [Alphaproteobacteria bacterium]
MTPEERRKKLLELRGKAKRAAAEAQKAAAEAKRIAIETKGTAEKYMETGNAYIAKGAEATGKFIEKANEKSEQFDRAFGKLVNKFFKNPDAVQEETVEPPKPSKPKKRHWKL